MTESERWRVFCAVDLPDDVREQVLAHSMRLRQAVPEAQASWSRAGNIHLTLKFLGDITSVSVQSLSDAASRAVAGLAAFRIRLEHAGVFPPRGSPRVLWIGVSEVAGKLVELHRRLEDEAATVNFPTEPRPFHPHLTLARLRKPQHSEALAAVHRQMGFEPVEFTVSDLLVIRSELSSAGSTYTTISRHPLDGKQTLWR